MGPLLIYGCTRSRPGVQVGQASHPYSSYDSSSHSGRLFYPTYESYISGMVENDFFFMGYKQMPEPPRPKLRAIESVPWNVRFRSLSIQVDKSKMIPRVLFSG